jgi:hypothetical protein
MKYFLSLLSLKELLKIGRDYSIEGSRPEVIDALMEKFKDYSITVDDLKSRYGPFTD